MNSQIEMEEAIRRNNLEQETTINMDALKGGIPQSHKYQPKTALMSFKRLKPGKIYMNIIECLRKAGEPLTDRQIKERLGKEDMNNVRPRISELIDFDFLIDHAERICPKTKVGVRTLIVNEKKLKEFLDN